MYNLVWKDILIVKRYLWVALFYGFIAVIAFSYMKDGALSAATVGVTYMLIVQACIQDDKNKSEIMLNSLPLRRRNMVLAKYLSVIPYTVLAILSFLFAQEIVAVTGIPIPITRISLEGIFGALIATTLFLFTYFPIYFRFGYLRSRVIGIILFMACFSLAPVVVILLGHGAARVHNYSPALQTIGALLQRLVSWLQTQSDWQIVSYLLSLDLILMVISVWLSLRFYSRKEF